MKKKFLISLCLFLSIVFQLNANADNIEEAAGVYNNAIDLYKQEKVEDSITLFKKAINLNPNFYEAYFNLSQILMSLNRDEEAYENLAKAVELKPSDTDSLYNAGKIQYKRGYLSSSYGYFTKIPKTAPQYESARILIARIEKRQKELNLEAKLKEKSTKFDSQGRLIGVDIETITAPSGVAVDSKGNLYIAAFGDNAIYKISTLGQKTTFSKSGIINGPIGLAIDKDDNVYIANYSGNNLIKITPEGISSVFADIQKPYCLIYDAKLHRIYATEQNTNKLIKFDLQ